MAVLYVAAIGRVDAYWGSTARALSTTRLTGPVAGGANDLLVIASDGRLIMGVSV